MRSGLVLALLAACAHGANRPPSASPAPVEAPRAKPPALVVAPAAVGTRRTVTYRFFEDLRGAHFKQGPRVCSMLVLAEEVVRATFDRELELAIEIVGGNDPALCDVGGKATIAAGGQVSVSAGPTITDNIRYRLRTLHQQLGTMNGTFALGVAKLPIEEPARAVTDGGVAYLDRTLHRQTTFGPYPSEGDRYVSSVLRVRESDHSLACASVEDSAHGDNFEYGGWSEHIVESIIIDDGSGPPRCPASPR